MLESLVHYVSRKLAVNSNWEVTHSASLPVESESIFKRNKTINLVLFDTIQYKARLII